MIRVMSCKIKNAVNEPFEALHFTLKIDETLAAVDVVSLSFTAVIKLLLLRLIESFSRTTFPLYSGELSSSHGRT